MLLHALPNMQGAWILRKQRLRVWHTPGSRLGGKEQRAIQVNSRDKGSPVGAWIVGGGLQSRDQGLPGNLGLWSLLCPPAPISLQTDYILEVLCFCSPKLSVRQTLDCHGNNWNPNFICSYHSRVSITWLWWLVFLSLNSTPPWRGRGGSSISNRLSALHPQQERGDSPKKDSH